MPGVGAWAHGIKCVTTIYKTACLSSVMAFDSVRLHSTGQITVRIIIGFLVVLIRCMFIFRAP